MPMDLMYPMKSDDEVTKPEYVEKLKTGLYYVYELATKTSEKALRGRRGCTMRGYLGNLSNPVVWFW